jgi:hypothetical protein
LDFSIIAVHSSETNAPSPEEIAQSKELEDRKARVLKAIEFQDALALKAKRLSAATLNKRAELESELLSIEDALRLQPLSAPTAETSGWMMDRLPEALSKLTDADVTERERHRAMVAQSISYDVDQIFVSFGGLKPFLSRRSAHVLDDTIPKSVERWLQSDLDPDSDAPAFAIYRRSGKGTLVQPLPGNPKRKRFECPLQPLGSTAPPASLGLVNFYPRHGGFFQEPD